MPTRPPTHRPHPRKAQPHQRNRQATRCFNTNSKAWRLLRMSVLVDEQFICKVCGQYGDQVDHIDGDSHNNARENLQVLCLRDHSAKTMRALNARRTQSA